VDQRKLYITDRTYLCFQGVLPETASIGAKPSALPPVAMTLLLLHSLILGAALRSTKQSLVKIHQPPVQKQKTLDNAKTQID
jgi:hypothetical protein